MHRHRALYALLLVSLLLASCGNEGKGASTHLTVHMTEFSFQPKSFTVPAGQDITLDLSNDGAIEHNFIIMNKDVQATPPFDEDDEAGIYWQMSVSPGGSTSTSFTAPSEPGDYEVICKTPGHLEAGMIGTLTVVESQ